jgi:hypothetical protein
MRGVMNAVMPAMIEIVPRCFMGSTNRGRSSSADRERQIGPAISHQPTNAKVRATAPRSAAIRPARWRGQGRKTPQA